MDTILNPDVAKLQAQYGEEVVKLAGEVMQDAYTAAHWQEGHQAAYERTIRLIGELVTKARKAHDEHCALLDSGTDCPYGRMVP